MIKIRQNVTKKKSGVMGVYIFDFSAKTAGLYQIPKLRNFNFMVPGVIYIDGFKPVPSLRRKLAWPATYSARLQLIGKLTCWVSE